MFLTRRYLHGPHHDALPVSFMAAHDTGMIEGALRFAVGVPDAFCGPFVATPMFASQVVLDMVFHQVFSFTIRSVPIDIHILVGVRNLAAHVWSTCTDTRV